MKSDECVFVHSTCVFVLYVDDIIFMSPDKKLVDKAIEDLIAVRCKIKDQGYLDFVGANIKRMKTGVLNCCRQH